MKSFTLRTDTFTLNFNLLFQVHLREPGLALEGLRRARHPALRPALLCRLRRGRGAVLQAPGAVRPDVVGRGRGQHGFCLHSRVLRVCVCPGVPMGEHDAGRDGSRQPETRRGPGHGCRPS